MTALQAYQKAKEVNKAKKYIDSALNNILYAIEHKAIEGKFQYIIHYFISPVLVVKLKSRKYKVTYEKASNGTLTIISWNLEQELCSTKKKN